MAVDHPIPDVILIPAVNYTLREFAGACVDNWGEMEKSSCRVRCGETYQHIETDWIGKRAINLRKGGKLDSVNGGPKRKKWKEPDGEYAEYLASDHWQQFQLKVLEFWHHRCCLCNKTAKDVHHNNYARVPGSEDLTDCVALCRSCHKAVHGKMADGDEYFNNNDEGGLF